MCKVLDNYGQVQQISSKNLGQKHNRKALATDAHGNTISPGDTVQTTDLQKRKAVILHVYRGLAFLYSREYPENEGVFYEKTDNILLVNGKNMKVIFIYFLNKNKCKNKLIIKIINLG